MVSVFPIFLLASCVLAVHGERLYTPPSFDRRNNPTPPSYAAAVDPSIRRGVFTTPAPTVPPRGGVPARGPPAAIGSPKQGTGEFLPQNLTFAISVRNLKSKSSDPVVKVSKNTGKGGVYELLGKTETIDNNANPDFLKVFWIIWKKGTQQKLKFEVRDVDNFRRDDPLGQVEVNLDEYVARSEKLNLTLQNGTGSILVQKTTPIKFRLYARALPNADTIGKSDPYAEVYWSKGSNGKKIKFAKTSVIENNENPDWNETFEFANYIKGTDQWWTIKVFDSDPTGSDDLGEGIVEIDPFVAKRQTKMISIGKKGNAKVAFTPA